MTTQLQRCRSHEVNSNPQAWETVASFATDAELMSYVERNVKAMPPQDASGDQYQVIAANGEAFGLTEYLYTIPS